MLQQTQSEQAIPYFNRFLRTFPNVKTLAAADQEEVLKAWEGLGYYSRARNLHKAAKLIAENKGTLPNTIDGLLALPGIGPYSASAIGSLAFNLDAAVVDGNVIRVITRLTAFKKDVRTQKAIKQIQTWMNELLIPGRSGEFNEAMMELGATCCTPTHPIAHTAHFVASAKQKPKAILWPIPKRQRKKHPPHIHVGAALITNSKRQILIARRRESDMLGGLWEFPGGKQEKDESIRDCIQREIKEELGIDIKVSDFFTTVRHTYSHFSIDLHTYWAEKLKGRTRALHCDAFRWASMKQMRELPFSRADIKIIEKLEKQ